MALTHQERMAIALDPAAPVNQLVALIPETFYQPYKPAQWWEEKRELERAIVRNPQLPIEEIEGFFLRHTNVNGAFMDGSSMRNLFEDTFANPAFELMLLTYPQFLGDSPAMRKGSFWMAVAKSYEEDMEFFTIQETETMAAALMGTPFAKVIPRVAQKGNLHRREVFTALRKAVVDACRRRGAGLTAQGCSALVILDRAWSPLVATQGNRVKVDRGAMSGEPYYYPIPRQVVALAERYALWK